MEVSQIGAGGLLGATTTQAASTPANQPTKVAVVAPETVRRDAVPASAPRRQALSILRQEIRQVLQANFRISFAAAASGYTGANGTDARSVAGDALNGASVAAKRTPLDASRVLLKIREQVEVQAKSVREIINPDGDDDDLDDAMSRIREGFDDLDDDAARNVESSATMLSAESRLKQRSTIRIRTQEGDIVRFDLRRVEKASVEDVSLTTEDGFFSATQVELSSRSRMLMRVNGDLNEAEYAAIQNVFAQAELIADEFFAGDIAAAFDLAAGIQFDSEQLARVNLRFRERFESQVSFAASGPALTRPTQEPTPEVQAPATPEPLRVRAPTVEQPATIVPLTDKPVSVKVEPDTKPAAPEAPPVAASPALADSALDGFFDLLSSFLRNVTEGFEPAGSSASYRYYYSQSFNLQILRSVLELKAPDESRGAADTASALLEGVAEAGEDD